MPSPIKHSLIERRGLDASEISEIKHLADLCNQHEELDLKLNWGILYERPVDQLNDFLYYADGQLVGFLALFSFNSQEGEISGMVHPASRRRGIFSALFAAVQQECRSRGLSTLLLIVEQASPAGQAFVRHQTATYDHSEYKMVLEELRLPNTLNKSLQIRPARSGEVHTLSHITAQAFDMPEDEVDWYAESVIVQPHYYYYVGEIDGVVIGKIDVRLSEESALIMGFAVLPEYQGKGYGRQILAYTVREIFSRGQQNIWLEVSAENKHALSLYQSCGFKETSSYDYYRLPLKNE